MAMMETRQWLNRMQPQTLQIAVMLMYFDAVFDAILGGIFSPIGILFIAGFVAAGYGISNEKKWGYWLGVAIAGLRLALFLLPLMAGASPPLLGLMFAVAKLALLLHPMSRDYQRIWFK